MPQEKQAGMVVLTEVGRLREVVAAARGQGKRIGLVPTMGALHEGHLSLVRASKAECGLSVVSIYVNPTQFGPSEDLDRYPRNLESDLDQLRGCGAEVAFVPSNQTMYPEGCSTWVEPGEVAGPWEGECRPGHFRGVATVVLKLLNMVQPDVAYFGQKDYQQARVVRKMVDDLNVPVAIHTCPTVREPDGLAMSSRNRYLDSDARQKALVLWRSLCVARETAARGERDAATIVARMRKTILAAEGASIDYAALADPETLAPVVRVDHPAVALVAVNIDGTRLIDNLVIAPP